MKNAITIRQMTEAARRLNEKGDKFTLIGVGPMSKTLIRAVLELADEKDFPKIIKQAAKAVRKVEPDCDIEEI